MRANPCPGACARGPAGNPALLQGAGVEDMNRLMGWALAAALLLGTATADAGRYADTIELFKNAGASAQFFKDCYAYAVFPSIGQGALVVGGAHGKGHVYVQNKYVGNTTMTQVSVGFQ